MLNKRLANVTTYTFVAISLIICLGSVYWFVLNNGYGQKQNNPNYQDISVQTESITPEIDKEPNFSGALQELRHEGCKIIKLDSPLFLENPQYVSYKEFKTNALETKIVVLSPSDSGNIMVVLVGNCQFIWVPSQ